MIPTGVMIPVINSAGVTSNAGFNAELLGFAVRTYVRLLPLATPHAPNTSASSRSSIGIASPDDSFQSIVESGIAT